MSGRGRSNGRGRSSNDRRGGGRGQRYNGVTSTATAGMCAALGTHVFDYGHKDAADQMKSTWEKLVLYIGINYGRDIQIELHNKQTVILAEPTLSAAIKQTYGT